MPTTNPGNLANYLNLNCFTLPTAPASFAAQCKSFAVAANTCANLLGNEGRNSIIGPGFFNLDFSVFKNNYIKSISENFNVQLRAEFFNVLNHAAFLAPINNSTLFDGTGARSRCWLDRSASRARARNTVRGKGHLVGFDSQSEGAGPTSRPAPSDSKFAAYVRRLPGASKFASDQSHLSVKPLEYPLF